MRKSKKVLLKTPLLQSEGRTDLENNSDLAENEVLYKSNFTFDSFVRISALLDDVKS